MLRPPQLASDVEFQLITRLLDSDPTKRPSFKDVVRLLAPPSSVSFYVPTNPSRNDSVVGQPDGNVNGDDENQQQYALSPNNLQRRSAILRANAIANALQQQQQQLATNNTVVTPEGKLNNSGSSNSASDSRRSETYTDVVVSPTPGTDDEAESQNNSSSLLLPSND
jgi:hypothetical protein